MKQELNFWVLGGDLRQEKLAGLLREDGHRVSTYALSEPEADLARLCCAQCAILPLPVSIEEGKLNAPQAGESPDLETIFAALRPEQFLCGGMVNREVRDLAERYGLTIHDYFAREELAVANAVPTAFAVSPREKQPSIVGWAAVFCIPGLHVSRMASFMRFT